MPGVIHCDNPWCATATKTHKSTFAKNKCDAQRGRSASVGTSFLMPRRRTSAVTDVIGDAVETVSVSYADLHDAHLDGGTIRNASLEEVSGTTLTRATLERVTFGAGIDGATLEDATGSHVIVEHVIKESKLINAHLSHFEIGAGTVIADCSFSGARLNDSRWGRGVEVSNSSFQWASLRRSHFAARVLFKNCDLTGVDFSNCEFAGTERESATFDNCEIDMANFSGVNLRDAHMDGVLLSQRIYFVDSDTLPPLEPGTLTPTAAGREFMTQAMTDEQYDEYTVSLDVSEIELRGALARLSPAFVPVYENGAVGERGELLRRAAAGEDIEMLSSVQSEVWARSAAHNALLVEDPAELYG